MTNVRAAMLKINPGIVFGGGVGVDGKEEARNTVWPDSVLLSAGKRLVQNAVGARQ